MFFTKNLATDPGPLKLIRTLSLLFLGGVGYALGFPFKEDFAFPLFSILGMGILWYQLHYVENSRSFLDIALKVIAWSLGYYLGGYYWIPYTISEFGMIPFPFNQLLGLTFSLVIVPHIFIIGLVWWFVQKKKASLIKSLGIFLPFFYTFFEQIIPQQFPAHLGHVWLSWLPTLGLAPYFGAPFYSLFSYAFIFSILEFFVKKNIRVFFLHFTFSLVALIAACSVKMPEDLKDGKKIVVRMVQANVGNFLKLSSESGNRSALNEVIDSYYQLSSEQSEFGKLDLIIWPETAYPRLLNHDLMLQQSLYVPRVIKNTILATNAEVFTGGYDRAKSDNTDFFESEYNTGFFFGDDLKLKDFYHKRILIPFGESMPFGPLNSTMAKIFQNVSFFAEGNRFTHFKTKDDFHFVSAICYEILFTHFVRRYLNSMEQKPDFLINLTNDSWYGKTSEPYQHLFLAKWRALEFDLPIFRMTNTGITSVVYANGTESKRLQIFEKDFLDFEFIQQNRPKTLYQKIGFWGWGSLGLLLSILTYFLGLNPSFKRS